MSTLNQHLVRRGAIYHFRRRLPSPLKEILSRSHFDGSLQTADPALARRLARKVTVALDQLTEALQGMPPDRQPTPGQLNLVLKELFDSILRDGDRRRELIGDGLTALPNGNRQEIHERTADPETMAAFEVYKKRGIFYDEVPETTAERWREHAAINELREVNPYLAAALKTTGISVDLNHPTSLSLRQDALRVLTQSFEIDLERWDGVYGPDQRAPSWIDDKYPVAPALLQTWSGRLNAEEVNFLARTVEDVAEEYIGRNLRHTRARKTERDWAMAIDYFVALVGNKAVGDITEKDVDDFRERLLDVPCEYGKGIFGKKVSGDDRTTPAVGFVNQRRTERFRERVSPKAAIETRKKIEGLVREAEHAGDVTLRFQGHDWSLEQARGKTTTMTRKTANKHLSFFTKMWASRVVPKSLRPMSPFAGALYPKSEVRKDAVRAGRADYTKAELERLFTSPVWTGCRSASRRSIEGNLIIPDARFWAPLIAIFTGMRREEICQLKGTDFDEHGGIWFVRVQATEGRSLKTPAAERDIPIHEELIRIGLREYVDFRYPNWLFPELRPSETDRALGDGLGKWYHRYRQAVSLTRRETDFHSFRTTFTQYLRRAGVPLDHIKPITGHQENDVTLRHYAPVFGLDQKKAVIEKFELGVSFPQLYGRMPELLANLETAPNPAAPRRRKTGGTPTGEAAAAE